METRHPDPLLDWVSIPTINFPRISSKREEIGFFWDPEGRVELYVLALRGGSPVQLTHGELPKSPSAPIVWDPNDRTIVFSKDTEGNELHDLYRLDRRSGAVTRLTHDPTCQRYPLSFSPDGRWLLLASDQALGTDSRQFDLWRIPAAGGEAERLTHHRQPLSPWIGRQLYSPDGRWIVYAASDQDDPRDTEVFVVGSEGGVPDRLFTVKKGSREIPVTWSPDGRQVAIESDAFEFSRVGLLDPASRETRWLGAGTADETPVDFSPDGRSLLALRTQGVRIRPIIYDLSSGTGTVVPLGIDLVGEVGFLPDSQGIVVVRVESNRPNGIVGWRRADGAVTEILPPAYGPVSPKMVVASEVVRYPTFDGREIEALLYRPSGQSSRGPALVKVHGGPTWQFTDIFDGLDQYLVSRGFCILEPNVRGSTGYGSQFRDLNLQDLGGGDLKDVAAAVEYLRRLPYVDPKRIGIFGGSYGGYLTYAALTWYPDLWAAGVAIAGVTDWEVCYKEEVPALQHYDRQLMGDPVEKAALYRERSPVHFAENVRAPIFMIHGVNDPRCPVSQARLFRDALVRHGRKEGRDFEYLEFSDEGHGSADREQMLRAFRPGFAFLERHLLDTS